MRAAIGALVVCAATAAAANTSHHHVGGSGGEAECIRWEPIPVDMAGRDMAARDMSLVDMAGGDGGTATTSVILDGGVARDMATSTSASHAGMRCAERASLFSCAYGSRGGVGWGGVALFAVLALSFGRARRRSRG